MLVVSKRRIIMRTWPKEIEKWRKLDMSYTILRGVPEEERKRRMNERHDVYLINFENLQWLCKNWKPNDFGRCMLVVDESSHLRNVSNKRFKSFRYKLKEFERRYILTGSPTPNGLMNLYGQMYVVDQGEALGKYISQFRNRYFVPTGYMGKDWQPADESTEEQIYEKIGTRIHRAGRELLDMPDLINVTREVTLSPSAYKTYRTLEQDLFIKLESGVVTASNAAVATGKLRQVANGAVYETKDLFAGETGQEGKGAQALEVHTEKIEELIDLLEELQGTPALIAYEFMHDRQRITAALSKAMPELLLTDDSGRKYLPFIGGGSTDADDERHMDLWNEGKIPALLAHPNSVAHGLNLQGTHGAIEGCCWMSYSCFCVT